MDSDLSFSHLEISPNRNRKFVLELLRGRSLGFILTLSQISERDERRVILKHAQMVQSVELSTIAHATDDLEKVQAALTRLLPEPLKSRQLFTRRYLQGHYGNPITTFEAHLTEPIDVDQFKFSLLKQLPEKERLSIMRDLHLHTDQDGNLYIRLDKQKMFRGTARLSQDDPIRIRMKFTNFAGSASALMIKCLELQ